MSTVRRRNGLQNQGANKLRQNTCINVVLEQHARNIDGIKIDLKNRSISAQEALRQINDELALIPEEYKPCGSSTTELIDWEGLRKWEDQLCAEHIRCTKDIETAKQAFVLASTLSTCAPNKTDHFGMHLSILKTGFDVTYPDAPHHTFAVFTPDLEGGNRLIRTVKKARAQLCHDLGINRHRPLIISEGSAVLRSLKRELVRLEEDHMKRSSSYNLLKIFEP